MLIKTHWLILLKCFACILPHLLQTFPKPHNLIKVLNWLVANAKKSHTFNSFQFSTCNTCSHQKKSCDVVRIIDILWPRWHQSEEPIIRMVTLILGHGSVKVSSFDVNGLTHLAGMFSVFSVQNFDMLHMRRCVTCRKFKVSDDAFYQHVWTCIRVFPKPFSYIQF